MSEAKHTPGPWILRGSDNGTPHILHQQHACAEQDIHDQQQLVCVMPAEIARSYNAWPNARLIVTAPELLEALQAARDYVQTSRDSLAETHRHPVTMKPEPEHVCSVDDALLSVIDAAIAKATGSA
jgi:hypothetical protein